MVHSGRSGDEEKALTLPTGPGLPAFHRDAAPCAGWGVSGVLGCPYLNQTLLSSPFP